MKKIQGGVASGSADVPAGGLTLAVVQRKSPGHPKDMQTQPTFCAVVEKFSVSVMFSRVDVVDIGNAACLQWKYDESNCVESTLFMMSYHSECLQPGACIGVGCVVLTPERSVLLIPQLDSSQAGLTVDSVLQDLKPCFELSCDILPGPTPVHTKQKHTHKPSARASQGQSQKPKQQPQPTKQRQPSANMMQLQRACRSRLDLAATCKTT